MRGLLVSAEVALALMLTIGAALLIKHLASLQRTDPGFVVENVLTMKLSLPEAKYGRTEALALFSEQVEQRLSRLPGVSAAAMALSLPLEMGPDLPFSIEGKYVPGTKRGTGARSIAASALTISTRYGSTSAAGGSSRRRIVRARCRSRSSTRQRRGATGPARVLSDNGSRSANR